MLFLDGHTPRSGMWPGSAWAWTTYKQLQPCCCNDRRGQARFQKEGEGVMREQWAQGYRVGCSRRGVRRDATAPTWTSSCFCSGLPPRGSWSPQTTALGPCSERRSNSHAAYRCSVRRTAGGAWRVVAGCEDGPAEWGPRRRSAHPRSPH